MLGQKPKTSFIKLSETLSAPDFNANPNVPGLSVRYNQPFFEQDLFRRHFRSDYFNALLLSKGELSALINLERYTIKKDTLVLVAPHTIKKVEKVSADSLVSGVNFTVNFLTAIGMPQNAVELPGYFSSHFPPCWELDKADAAALQWLIKQLDDRITSLNDHEYGKELLNHTFYIFFYELYGMSKKYAAQVKHHVTRKENLVMNFTQLVQKQFRKNRNVQAYAEQLNITPKYLTETVKEITGQTAGEIIDSYVMMEAKLLLDDPVLSVAQVAEELHFSDQSFFGKFFKRHTGISPKEYRQAAF